MSSVNLRYSEFAREIDVDAFEQEIGFEPVEQARGFDIGICPDPWGLHKNGDSTGKFGIHRENRTFNCFVCGGGNLLALTMAIKDTDEEEAIDWIYQFAKPIDQADEDYLDEIDRILAVAKAERSVWPYFNEHVLDQWKIDPGWPLTDNIPPIQWLKSRGVSVEIAMTYKVRYNAEHTRKSKSKGIYTGPGMILPHFWQDKLVGWQVRWLDDDRPKWVPKYTNTHDFPRERTIFNYEQVYFSERPIVVVESVPTVLFLVSLGIPAVATFGSNVSDEQIRLLRKCQQGIVLARDNDSPGHKWIESDRPDVVPLAESLARYVTVQVAEPVPGEGADLGDLVSEPDLVHAVIEAAEYY